VRRHRREGVSLAGAVRRAVAETGNAIVLGGLVLSVGFAAVMVSSVPSLAGFGMLACAAVASATIAELVFLPALLVVADGVVRQRWPVPRDGIFGCSPLPSWSAVGPEAAPAGKLAG
jgi:predicted RND superfamily exporter protein